MGQLLEEVARNLGLMLHNIGAEVSADKKQQTHTHSRKVEEENPAPGIIIRRTIIEEIILEPSANLDALKK